MECVGMCGFEESDNVKEQKGVKRGEGGFWE